jgi:hypothetical protein
MQNIIVIFEAKDERVEGLALAFGLGGVQRGANIRLRHLNPSPETRLAHQSYGTLQPNDLLWAEGIGVFLESSRLSPSAGLVAAIAAIPAEELRGKCFYVFGDDPQSEAVQAVQRVLPADAQQLRNDPGLRGATPDDFTRLGQQFAEMNAREVETDDHHSEK